MPRSSLLNVPYTGLREVESTAPPSAWQNIKVSDEMFGSQVGAALKGFGNTLGELGSTLAGMEEKNKAEEATTLAQKSDIDLMKRMTIIQDEYSRKQGADAADGFDDYDKKVKDAIAESSKIGAGNKRAEKLIAANGQRYYKNAWMNGFKHKTDQVDKDADDTAVARTNQAIESAAVAQTEESLDHAIDVVNGATRTRQRNPKNLWSEERTKAEIANVSSTAYTKFIANMAINDPIKAQEWSTKYDTHITDADKKIVRQAIDAGIANKVAPDAAAKDAAAGGPIEPPVAKPVTGPSTVPGAPRGPREPSPFTSVAPPPAPAKPGEKKVEVDLEEPLKKPAGLVEKGNIDLDKRAVLKNKDGSFSTEKSFSTNIDGKEVLLPTIINGKEVSQEEAVKHFKKTGQHLGKFNTPEEADAYAEALHKRQEQKYGPKPAETKPETKPTKPAPTAPDRHKVSEREYPPESTEISAQSRTYAVGPTGTRSHAIPGYPVGSAEVEHYVVNAAKARGIDPGTALAVYFSEGSAGFKSSIPGENSWGPFQLYTGDGKGRTGLGNTFVDSGHGDPSDPNNWKKTVDFALNKAVEGGWGPWNGAKVVGVTGRQGIANDARVIPVGAQVHQDDPDDYVEESTKPTEMKDRSVISYANQVNRGDLNAKPKAGSRVIEAQNGIRNKPIDPALKNAFETAATATGVQIRVTSGGQTPDRDPAKKDQPGGWTGSLRHNHGRAADVDILDESGRVITDRNDPRRLAFLEAVAKAGAGGIGTGYMGDPLKVHIGITGASGEVGKGLGVYSRQSTPQEVAAIERGLKAGGVLDHISPGYSGGAYAGGDGGGHRVRYASLNTGTMTDASPAPQSYRPQYAQATGADGATVVTSTGAKTWGPVTAETPPAEIEARLKEARDKQNAAGWNHAAISAYEHEFKGNWEKAKQQKAFVLKEADTEISKAVQGFPEKGVPRAKSFKDITDDPKLAAKVEILQQNNPERVEHFRREVLRLNSTGKGRSATPEDREAFIGYMGMSRSNPEEFVKLKLSEIDIDDRHRDQLITRQIQLNEGKDANLEKRIMDNALGIPSVRAQLRVAQILPPSDREDKENPNDPYYKFSGALEAEISAYRADPKNKGALPDSKWITDKTNELLRITGTEKSGGFFGLGAKATPTFEFQVPKKFEAEMTADFKKSGEVPTPRAQREWMIKKRRSGEFNYW